MPIRNADVLISNNPSSYGIVRGNEVIGAKVVQRVSDLYNLPDGILSYTKGSGDSLGQLWYVIDEKSHYKLVSWENRKSSTGWEKFTVDIPEQTGSTVKLTGFKPLPETVVTEEELTPVPGDTVNQGIAKLLRAALNNEEVIATAFSKIKDGTGLNENLEYIPGNDKLGEVTSISGAIDKIIEGTGNLTFKSTEGNSINYNVLGDPVEIVSGNTVDFQVSGNKLTINTKIPVVSGGSSSTSGGLMSQADKQKLDRIQAEANKTVVDSSLNSSSTNPVQNKVIYSAISNKAEKTHTHTLSQISDKNSSWDSILKSAPNDYITRWPNVGEVTGKKNLIIKFNGGTTEGTNLFTYNATSEKTINISSASIGAASSEHNHDSIYVKKSGDSTITGSLTSTGFKKSGSSDSYVLLGGGGHKALSELGRPGICTTWGDPNISSDSHVVSAKLAKGLYDELQGVNTLVDELINLSK